MEMLPDTAFSIIGAGRIGTSMGVLLKRAGHRILACSASTADSLERAVTYLGCFSSTNIHEVYQGADAILISVPDAVIPEVAESIARKGIPEGTVVVHASGAFGLAPLIPLRACGARLAAVHTLQSVPSVEAGIERIPGSWFGATCDPELVEWVESFVSVLDGKVYWVPEAERALYHAAAAVASNYLVVLASLVERMGLESRPYLSLMEGTIANVEEMGPTAALTGPIVRGDVDTVRNHLEAIRSLGLSDIEASYRVLGRSAVEVALKRGSLDETSARMMKDLLADER